MFAPADFNEDGGFDLKVYVDNLGGDAKEVDVTIQYAQIKLSVDQGEIATESDDIANVAGNVVIPVRNSGLLDATSVIVYLKPVGEGTVEFQQTITVRANETVNAVFENITREQGDHRFEVRLEVVGEEANNVESITLPGTADQNGIHDFQLRYDPEVSTDGDSIWLTLAVVVLGSLVVYGGVKTARSGRSGSKF